MALKEKNRSRLEAVVSIFLVALVLILVNFLISRHFLRLDLTEDNEYTLAESTLKILRGLEDRVIVKLYMSRDIPVSLAPLQQGILDLLDEYQNRSKSKITIERIAPEESPQLEGETQMMGIPPLQLDVIARDKREVRKVYLGLALLHLDKKEVIPVVNDLDQLEYNLTSAILKLTSKELPRIGLVFPEQNSSDNPYSFLEEVLSKDFQVEKLSGQDPDPGKNRFQGLMIVEPHELDESFVKKLDDLLAQGTSLIIFAGNVEVSDNLTAETYQTGLEEWLKAKGIELLPSLVIDPKSHSYAAFSSGYLQYHIPYPFFVKVGKDGLNGQNQITSRLEGMMFPWTNSLLLHSEDHPEWNYEILAQSSEGSLVQEGPPNLNPNALEEMEVGEAAKRTLALLATQKEKTESMGHLLVVANNHFIKNSALSDYDANILLALNTADWMSRGEALIGIRSRGKTDRPLTIPSGGMINLIKAIHIMGLPLAFILFGLLFTWRRRRKWTKLCPEKSSS